MESNEIGQNHKIPPDIEKEGDLTGQPFQVWSALSASGWCHHGSKQRGQ